MDKEQRKQIKTLLAKTDALLQTVKFIYEIESKSENMANSFASHISFIDRHNELMGDIAVGIGNDFKLYHIDKTKVPSWGNSLPGQRRQVFDAILLNLNIVRAELHELSGNVSVTDDLRMFVRTKLRASMHSRPEKELEIQNALETLLVGRGYSRGIDYDRETGRIKTGTKESIPDFIFPRLAMALEVKLTKNSTDRQRIVDEINADIQAYGKKYETIIFIVYDLGSIRNEDEFKHEIEDKIRIFLEVIKH